MQHLQRNFINFHNAIQINDPNGNSQLKTKRVHLLETLRARLAKRFAGTDTPIPHFEAFNQGSYSMGTGVIPLKGSFDIDIGIVLPVYKKDAEQLTRIKKGIYEELCNASNGQVEVKEPCIRVKYLKNGRPWYHVDLAIYAKSRKNQNLYLARGKLNAQHKEWEFAEPRKLKELISGFRSNHEYRNQFARCIRYLKRWKDQENKFRSSGHSAPTGIAITALAFKDFEPVFTGGQPDDLTAIRRWIPKIINRFTPQDTISVKLPVRPHNNLFEKMGSKQQKSFKNKLITLNEALKYADKETNTTKAATRLNSEFGEDFPLY